METRLLGEPNRYPCCLCYLELVLAWSFPDATCIGRDMGVVDVGSLEEDLPHKWLHSVVASVGVDVVVGSPVTVDVVEIDEVVTVVGLDGCQARVCLGRCCVELVGSCRPTMASRSADVRCRGRGSSHSEV